MRKQNQQQEQLPHEDLAQNVQEWLAVLASKWALEIRECTNTEDAQWMLFQFLAQLLQDMGEGIYNAQQEKLTEISRDLPYDRDELLRMVRERLDQAAASLSGNQVLSLAFILEIPIKAGGAAKQG